MLSNKVFRNLEPSNNKKIAIVACHSELWRWRHFAEDGIFKCILCTFMPLPLGTAGTMFSGCPSVRPNPEIPSFYLYMGSLVHPTNRDRFSARPSVRPDRFPGISRRTHEGNGLQFCMLVYPGNLQSWLDYSHGLLIFLFWRYFDLVKRVKFAISMHFPENAWRDWPEILHADVSWQLSKRVRS